MGRNLISEGEVVLIPIPAGGCKSGGTGTANSTTWIPGEALKLGADVVGIPSTSHDAGETGNVNVHLCGVYSNIKKKSGDVFAFGDKVYLDEATSSITTTSSGNVWAGWAWEAAASTDTICTIKLRS